MKEFHTTAILLRIIPLANDDALVSFFTGDRGKITCRIPKLARSQNRKRELDFFRLLTLDLFEGRSSYSVRGIQTDMHFSAIQNHYALLMSQFRILSQLEHVLPEEKPFTSLFHLITQAWENPTPACEMCLEAYLRVQILKHWGVIERFDVLRGDVGFDPVHFQFDRTVHPGWIFISHRTRQVLEWLRRSTWEDFCTRWESIPSECIKEAFGVIRALEIHQCDFCSDQEKIYTPA